MQHKRLHKICSPQPDRHMKSTESVPLRHSELESSVIETRRMEEPPQVPSANTIPFPDWFELTRFREDGFMVIENGRMELVSEARHVSKPRAWPGKLTFRISFDMMVPASALDFLVRCMNNRISIRRSAFPSQAALKDTCVKELVSFIGIRILLENQRSPENSNVRDGFNTLKESMSRRKRLPFGVNRYELLASTLVVTPFELEEFILMVSWAWFRNWDTDGLRELCVDETIFDYEPRMDGRHRADIEKEERTKRPRTDSQWSIFLAERVGKSPVIHIPDKPHDGLMAYGLATKSSKTNAPYLLHLVPYLGDEVKIEEVLRRCISLFPSEQLIHLILDARFASWQQAQSISLLFIPQNASRSR